MSNTKQEKIIVFRPLKKKNKSQKFNTKIISIMTNCEICGDEITINNVRNHSHFCKKCENVDIDMISNELIEELDSIILDDPILHDDLDILLEDDKDDDI